MTPKVPIRGPQPLVEAPVDDDVAEPRERAHEPERGQEAGHGQGERRERHDGLMHGVEEEHGARGQLTPSVRLADAHEGRKVGHDPEHQERDEADVQGR